VARATTTVNFRGKDVLEVGCGSGKFSKGHLLAARSVLGLDTDPAALAALRAEWPTLSQAQAEWKVGSVVTFPLPAEAFDAAVFSQSL